MSSTGEKQVPGNLHSGWKLKWWTSVVRLVFPWFAIDIGGSLVKLVYFEPLDLTEDEIRTEGEILMNIRHYLTSNRAYGENGVRDDALELKSIELGGRCGNLHFIRFPTSNMANFIDLCLMKHLHMLTFQVFATGGGAYKFERDALEVNSFSNCVQVNDFHLIQRDWNWVGVNVMNLTRWSKA